MVCFCISPGETEILTLVYTFSWKTLELGCLYTFNAFYFHGLVGLLAGFFNISTLLPSFFWIICWKGTRIHVDWIYIYREEWWWDATLQDFCDDGDGDGNDDDDTNPLCWIRSVSMCVKVVMMKYKLCLVQCILCRVFEDSFVDKNAS